MANIIISDLRPAGSEFFSDYESYLKDLTEDNYNRFLGGITPTWYVAGAIFLYVDANWSDIKKGLSDGWNRR